MSVEAIPIAPGAASYLDVGDADALATTLAGLSGWDAATEAERAAALGQASSDVDAAMPYQGRPADVDQVRQFPRVAYESRVGPPYAVLGADVVWDWDDATSAAVVPRDVKLATLYQADAILAGTREPRLGAQHDGVVYELTGTLAESYKQTTGPGVSTGLCRRSWVLMRQYRLRAGRLF